MLCNHHQKAQKQVVKTNMAFAAREWGSVDRMLPWHAELAVPFLVLSFIEQRRFHAKIFMKLF